MKKHLQRVLFLLVALSLALGAVSAVSDETEVRIITAVWMDSDNYDEIRPETVNASLAGEAATLNAENGWTDYVTVPAGTGNDWTYDTPDGYTATLSSPKNGVSLLTFNHYVAPTISVTGKAVWVDDNNAKKTRPKSVQLMLYADGNPYGEPKKATPGDPAWTVTWKNLPKRWPNSASDIEYTVRELQDPEGYVSSSSGREVTNTLQTAGLSVSASVSGDGIANPGAVTVKVDGPDPSMPVTLSLGSHDLGEVLPGAYIVTYSDTIALADGYVMDTANSKVCDAVYVKAGAKGTLEFRYACKEQEKEDVEEDYDPWAGISSLKFQILGPDPRMPVELTLADFTKVDEKTYRYDGDKLQNLVPGNYAIVEKNAETLVSYYYLSSESITALAVKVDPDNANGTIASLFDKYIPAPTPEPDADFVDIPVTKTWNDNNNEDGNRPESITVRLYADGVEVDSHVLTAAEGWSYTFTNKPRYQEDNRTEIVYSVNEDNVAMYTQTINGYNIVNNYNPEETSRSVAKIWQDNNNAQKRRPTSIAMSLSNGERIVARVILNAENGWSATVNHLPTHVNGKPAVYTWKEQEVVGYQLVGTEVVGNTTTFTNAIYARNGGGATGGKTPKGAGDTTKIDDYDTPLGVEIMINHVGDCFD